jgi:hypothetical protein
MPTFGNIGQTAVTATTGRPWILPVVGGIVTLLIVIAIVFAVIKNKSTSSVQTLKGPIDIYDPTNVVLVTRGNTTGSMRGSYTLSLYMRVDAVPDMRTQGTPFLIWPGVWSLNYTPSHEQLNWVFEQSPDNTGSAPSPDTITLPHVPLQRWNQIVIGFEGRTADLYVNGKLIKSDILSNVPPSAASSITIVPKHMMGQVAYVQLWPRRLTTTQVAANYVNTSDSQGRPYLGPELFTAISSIKLPNLFCPGGKCGGTSAAAQPSQTWEFPYA